MSKTKQEESLDIKSLLANVLKSRSTDFKVPFSLGNNKEIDISINKICFIEAKGELSIIHLDNDGDRSPTVAMSVGQCEKILKNFAFLRVHRSFLVNCTFIKYIQLSSETLVHLITGSIIPISRRKKESIKIYMIDVGLSFLLKS